MIELILTAGTVAAVTVARAWRIRRLEPSFWEEGWR